MSRISDEERGDLLITFLAHWETVDRELGSPLMLVPGYGRAELAAQAQQYEQIQQEIAGSKADRVQAAANRDAIWTGSGQGNHGIAFHLRLYPALVRARLGANHPQARLAPRLGEVTIERYLETCDRFLAHWQEVNVELGEPLLVGLYQIEDLAAARTELAAEIEAIARSEREARRAVEERERLFGDLPADRREEQSIVSRLLLYRLTVLARFHGRPLAEAVPDVFPKLKNSRRPDFRWSFSRDEAGLLVTRIENPGLADAAEARLRIDGRWLAQPLPKDAGEVIELAWPEAGGSAAADSLADSMPDKLNLRNARHYVIARGRWAAGER